MKPFSRLRPALLLLLAVGLLAPACDIDLGEEEPTVTTRLDSGIDFRVCQIADENGLDDHSYNQAIYRGTQRARANLGVDVIYREAVAASDLDDEVESLANRACNLIVMPDVVGDLIPAAGAYPDIHFVEIDTNGIFSSPTNGETEPTNLARVEFDTAQAAFLAGYVAAGGSDSDHVGVVQGKSSSQLRDAADSFIAGVERFSDNKGALVEATRLPVTPAPDDASAMLAREGSDIAFIATTKSSETIDPARAPVGLSLIWFGENGCRALPERCDRFFTSVVNNIDNATFDVIKNDVAGTFEDDYVGTLANVGVGLAPFNAFAERIPPDVRQDLVELRDQIISGEITIP